MQHIQILFLLLLAHYASAQCPGVAPTYTNCVIKYQYDAGGNRKAITRQCIEAPPDTGGGGTGKVAGNSGVGIYPNPTTGQVDILLDDATMEAVATDMPLTLTVFDLTGKQIMQHQVAADAYTIPLDLSNQAAGMYISLLRQGSRTVWQGKIIKTDR